MKQRVFFSGIGGTGIGPLALIAHQAGFEVYGSDMKESLYTHYLQKQGLSLHIGQTKEQIQEINVTQPIDWFVYSSALPANHPELTFAREHNIKTTKRDEFITVLLKEKGLAMFAIAGTHGKTTTTAMAIWVFKELGMPISYSVGAKISFGEMGQYQPGSKYFVYECDEFDRNFLAYHPEISLITGVTWDHHEIFPTRGDYKQAFVDFINQSQKTYLWEEDNDYLSLQQKPELTILKSNTPDISTITLPGLYNRRDAWLVVTALATITDASLEELIVIINRFPGTQRRMEKINTNLYSDYAHTPEKIVGCMSVAMEMAKNNNQAVVVVYEPLTNRRQHYMKELYKDCFMGAKQLYWVPSYLAREDPTQHVLSPKELIPYMYNREIAQPAELDEQLRLSISRHLQNGDLVVVMSGGGGGSLDEWIRQHFTE